MTTTTGETDPSEWLTVAPGPAVPPRVRAVHLAVPRWWRDMVGCATWASLLIVVALWVAGGGLEALTGLGAGLTSLGRLTGLVASDLLLIQVLLMARLPVVERVYGQDELARRHRLVGFSSFNLMMAHIVLITLGYALVANANLLAEAWDLVATYPGMLIALAGTLLLVLVTVTSIRKARRKLRYESWHLLHLYAYLGVGLSVPHEIWTGADFATSSLARVYWWSSYAAAAGAVLVFRVGLPIWRTLRHGITVTSVVRESPDVVTVRMGGRGLDRLPARAGQYFVWRFLDGPGWSRGHPFSLSAAPRRGRVQITAKDHGDGSGRLAGLQPGTRVLVEGPYGRLTGEHVTGSKVALLACGIGITPLRALLEDLPYAPGDAVLVHRVHSAQDLVFRDEIAELARRRGATVHHLIGPRVPGRASWLPAHSGFRSDSDALRTLIPNLLEHDVFICGPDAWMDAVCDATVAAGLAPQRLHQERFTW